MICELCGGKYVRSCLRCARRVETWGEDGTIALMELAKRKDNIQASELLYFINRYYIGKSHTMSDIANVLRTALEVLGYDRKMVIGRIHNNKTDYHSIRRREHENGRKWRLKKESCDKCGATTKLVLHHIVPISWGGISSDENCITLCESCHREIHRKLALTLNRSKLLQYLEPYKEEIYNEAVLSLHN